jgi:hypothetical protein
MNVPMMFVEKCFAQLLVGRSIVGMTTVFRPCPIRVQGRHARLCANWLSIPPMGQFNLLHVVPLYAAIIIGGQLTKGQLGQHLLSESWNLHQHHGPTRWF